MKTSSSRWILLPLVALAAVSASWAQAPAAATAAPAPAVTPASDAPPALVDQTFLYQVVRYLYRYQLDEASIDKLAGSKEVIFWVRRLHPHQDPGDNSEFGEIMFPQVGYAVRLKRSDYRIEEQDVDIKSRGFKVYEVLEGELPAQPPAKAQVVQVETEALLDYLFQSRFQRDFPAPALLDRLRKLANEEVHKAGLKRLSLDTMQQGENIIHVGPLSPVSNDIWCFWESGRRLYHFTSDIDLSNPGVWEQEHMKVNIYDLDQQVVTSHEEAPGSGRFLSRYEVGRALYNCIVIGQRMEITADSIEHKPVSAAASAPLIRPGKQLPPESRSVSK